MGAVPRLTLLLLGGALVASASDPKLVSSSELAQVLPAASNIAQLIDADTGELQQDLRQQLLESDSEILLKVGDMVDDLDATRSDCVGERPANACTLRGAMLFANWIGHAAQKGLTTIQLPPGTLKLAAQLPVVTGNLLIRGGGDDTPTLAPLPPEENNPGLLTPALTTTLDGVSKHRLLLTAPGSLLHLQSLKIRNGGGAGTGEPGEYCSPRTEEPMAGDLAISAPTAIATGGATGQPAAGSLGGAICALGHLEMTNVDMRNNRATYGGAIYTEGGMNVLHAILKFNSAAICGGGVYVGNAGRNAHFVHSTLSHNSDHCEKRQLASVVPQQEMVKGGDRKGAPPIDMSGAIAEGPRMTTHTLVLPNGLPVGSREREMPKPTHSVPLSGGLTGFTPSRGEAGTADGGRTARDEAARTAQPAQPTPAAQPAATTQPTLPPQPPTSPGRGGEDSAGEHGSGGRAERERAGAALRTPARAVPADAPHAQRDGESSARAAARASAKARLAEIDAAVESAPTLASMRQRQPPPLPSYDDDEQCEECEGEMDGSDD